MPNTCPSHRLSHSLFTLVPNIQQNKCGILEKNLRRFEFEIFFYFTDKMLNDSYSFHDYIQISN